VVLLLLLLAAHLHQHIPPAEQHVGFRLRAYRELGVRGIAAVMLKDAGALHKTTPS
jgi:hypothetical protein